MDSLITFVITFVILLILLSVVNLVMNYFSKGKKGYDFKDILIQTIVIVVALYIYREFIRV